MASLTIAYTNAGEQLQEEALAFIAEADPDAASNLAKKIEHGLERLRSFPGSGRKIPEALERPERELVIPPLRIFYRVTGSTLWVFHVMRSEQALSGDVFQE